MHAAVSRLLISAFPERLPGRADDTVGRMFYLKLLEHGRFTRTNAILEQIHLEIVAPIPITVPTPGKRGYREASRNR
jgi:hypothetical protein